MRKLKKVRTKKSNGLNCLWNISNTHYAHIQEVRAEIKYMCTINLSPNEIICSFHNHHGTQVHGTQLHLRFKKIFLFPKSVNVYGLLHWSVYRVGWLLTTRKWWATILPWGWILVLSFPLFQCCGFPQTRMGRPPQHGGALHVLGMISVTWSLKSHKSTAPLKNSKALFQRIWAVSQGNGFLLGNIQRVVWPCEKIGHPWGKCLASADRKNKGSG